MKKIFNYHSHCNFVYASALDVAGMAPGRKESFKSRNG